MTAAVCIACGAKKAEVFTECGSCNSVPKSSDDLVLSLVLSRHLCSEAKLEVFSYEIKNHLKLSVSQALLDEAKEALKDPQLLAMLGAGLHVEASGSKGQTGTRAGRPEPRSTSSSVSPRRKRSLRQSQLQKNPFAFLGVTTRDEANVAYRGC